MPSEPHLTDPDGDPVADEIGRAFERALADPPPDLDDDYGAENIWWSLGLPGGGGVNMRATMSDGPGSTWVITDVYVHAPEITATMLQNIPVSKLDLLMNLIGNFDADTIGEAANESWKQSVLANPDNEPSLAELRGRAADAPASLPEPAVAERPRLTRPDGTDPDSFYALVAAAYREYAPQTRAPALKIAEEAGVPVGTVRGWIREARRRGKLPAGTRGKVG